MRDWFLGFLDGIFPGKTGFVGKLQPLAAIRGNGLTEELTCAAQQEQFPNTGHAAWYNPPAHAVRETLWWFTASESPRFDESRPTWDLMQVDAHESSRDVIDCQALGSSNVVRQVLTGQGLPLRFTPSELVYLSVEGERWIGPISLRPHPTATKRWRIDSLIAQEPKLLIAPSPGPDRVVSTRVQGELRHIVKPAVHVPQIEWLDWASDDVLLKRVLRWISRRGKDTAESTSRTKQDIERLVDSLSERVGFGTEQDGMHRSQLERARAIAAELGQRDTLIEQIIQDIRHLPRVRAEIAARVDEEAVVAREQAIGSLGDEIAKRRATLEDLTAKIALKWTEYNDTVEMIALEQGKIETDRRRLQEEEAALEQRRETLRHEFEARVQELVTQPGALLADLAILRLVAPALQASPVTMPGREGSAAVPDQSADAKIVAPPAPPARTESGATERAPASQPVSTPAAARPSRWSRRDDELSLSGLEDSRKALRTACRAAGVSAPACLAVHAALLAGICPVVAGADGLDLLETYAQVITGGRLCWVPISPTVLDPIDLLGRPDGRGRMVPHASGLLDLVIQAPGDPDALTLVVLDGITRAPVDSYLAPLLAWQSTSHRGAEARQLPLCHAAALDSADEYSRCTDPTWPPNVLLAATLGQGATSLPASAEFWSRAVFVPLMSLSRDVEGGVQAGEVSPSTRSSVPSSTWGTWRHEAMAGDVNQMADVLDGFPAEFGLPRDPLGERFAAALSRLHGGPSVDVTRTLCLARILPYAVASDVWDIAEECFQALSSSDGLLEPAVRHARALLSGGSVRT